MMDQEIQHTDLLSADWSTGMILLLALASTGIWIAAHALSRRWEQSRLLRAGSFALRTIVGTVSLWLICNLLNRIIVLRTSSSIVAICAGSALVIELVVAFYTFERKFVKSRQGTALVAIRVMLVLSLALMLLQPVFAWNLTHTHERYVAVLLDDSESMQIADEQLTDSEKLRLLRVFDPTAAQTPYDLSDSVTELEGLADRLGIVARALQQSGTPEGPGDFTLKRQSIERVLSEGQSVVSKQSERLQDLLNAELPLDPTATESIRQLQHSLDRDVIARLVEADSLIQENADRPDVLAGQLETELNGIARTIREQTQILPGLIDAADRSFYSSLPPEVGQRAEQLAARTRAEIARSLLLGDSPKSPGLFAKLRDGYEVRLFQFDSQQRELELEDWVKHKESGSESPAADEPVEGGAASTRAVTDIASVLKRVQKEIPAEKLAGVLLVTDGRHNGPEELDPLLQQLGTQGSPVSALAMGSSRPGVDAAIVDLDFPKTVLVDDLLTVETRIRVTGMNDRKVRVNLFDGDESLAEQTVPITNDEFSSTIELNHTPKQEGFKNYRVKLEPVDADRIESNAFANNNERNLTVAISDNRTEILIVEGKPRWEYGYLRNLLANRDSTVQLQTVLFEPDRLLESDTRPVIHALASRNADEIEATALPENKTEWLKFDVIVLGDVAPERFTAEQIDFLYEFVNQRGGALVVIAGPNYMPHHFTNSKLAELLPCRFEAVDQRLFASPEASFRFRPTQIGTRHAIMRQADSLEAGNEIWNSIPEMYWRHPVLEVKPGAVVLAYAEPEGRANQFAPQPDETPEQRETRRANLQQFQQQHALVTIQSFGAGRILLLNTDRTWRLRYRVGDTYHHRFWGQVLRWAAADQLQAGTEFVRIGTDRTTYEPGAPIQVTARITDSYFAPVSDENATVKIYRGAELVLSKKLDSVEGAEGTYRADLGSEFAAGDFRVVLKSPEVSRLFAGAEPRIETQLTVLAPEINSQELIETSVDRSELARWTALSGGTLIESDAPDRLFSYINPGTQSYTETRSITLWDSWGLLLVMLLLLTSEWILRKVGGLV